MKENKNPKINKEAILVAGIAVLSYMLAAVFELHEVLDRFLRKIRIGWLRLDELIVVCTVLFFCLLILSMRRRKELKAEIARRMKAEDAEVWVLKKQIEFILGATRTGLDIIDSQYNLHYIDPEWAKHYGDPIGKKCYEYFMGRRSTCPDCGVARAFETKKTVVSEEVLPREGSRPIQVITIPYQDESGEWLVAEVNVDISERKRAEERLKQSKEQAELLNKITPSGIFTVDRGRLVTSWNDMAEKLTGYTPEEVTGRECLLFAVSPCKDKCGLYSDDVPKPISLKECGIVRKDGQRRTIVKNADFLRDSSGNIIGGIESFVDITERKKAEGELRKYQDHLEDLLKERSEALLISEARYRRLFESDKDGIFLLDASTGQINDVNPSLIDMLGYPKQELTGRALWEIGVFENEQAAKDKFLELSNKESIHCENMTLITKGGRQIRVEMICNVYLVNNIKVVHCNIRDITERVLLQRQKDEILRTVSHDIKTPLAIIKEGVSIVLDKTTGDINTRQQEILTLVNATAGTLVEIVNNMLDLSRLEVPGAQLQQELVDVADVIEKVVLIFNFKAKAKGLDLRVKLPSGKISIYSDRPKLIQVFSNLVGNAIKFTKEGYVEISVTEKANDIECVVSDTGRGIPGEDLEKVFIKFQQSGERLKGQDRGIGLGLTIAKDIIELHHGSIRVESELGRGSRFIFTLPKDSRQDRHSALPGPLIY